MVILFFFKTHRTIVGYIFTMNGKNGFTAFSPDQVRTVVRVPAASSLPAST
jgi:hypothetical protein